MRYLFLLGALLLTWCYYVGATQDIEQFEAFNDSTLKMFYALTGRDSSGTFNAYPVTVTEIPETLAIEAPQVLKWDNPGAGEYIIYD